MTAFTVSPMFSDHMVLLHSTTNPVWGTATAGAAVRVRLGAEEVGCQADETGRWQAMLPTPGPGALGEMEISCGEETTVFRDVAAGEVWLAGGQSNMEMPVLAALHARELACPQTLPDVRLFRVPRRCREEPQYGWHFQPLSGEDRGWRLPDKEEIARFSAIGYGFAALLARSLEMPVGVIQCDWGGTVIQAWMPEEELAAHEDTRADMAAYRRKREALPDCGREDFENYQASLQKVLEEHPDFVDRSLEDMKYYTQLERIITWPREAAIGDPNEPGCLFAHMVARTAPYGIRGVLWYQGESNAMEGEAARYAGLFARMRDCWERAWGKELPFLTCQIATFNPFVWGTGYDWPTLRQQQELCADTLPGVSMAVLVDVGELKDIHPHEKLEVACRLHRLALRDVYGRAVGDVFSPRAVACEADGDGLLVRFSAPVELRAGEPLQALGPQGAAPCAARAVDERTLRVDAPGAEGVSYGWAEWFEASLFGTNGQPVPPFRLWVQR